MYPSVREMCKQLNQQFELIPSFRKSILSKIAAYIQSKKDLGDTTRLVFICTHNSRRSHFGQIAAVTCAAFYSIEKVQAYSSGTEATAFHPNAIQALRELGFVLETMDETVSNPVWSLNFGETNQTTCFSKVYDDPSNPKKGFAAIMTCSEAELNCPFVPGTELRMGITYEDPKVTDGTPHQAATYRERFEQILREMLFAFSLVK